MKQSLQLVILMLLCVSVSVFSQDQTTAPVVNSPIIAGATSVSGTSTEADGTTIEVFVNGSSVGTTTVASNSWTLGSVPVLLAGQIVKATALADGKTLSDFSNEVTVTATQYRSVQSGNWSVVTTWEQWNGSEWVSASAAPTGTSGYTITIQSGHTVIVASALTINSGCNVVVNGYLKATAGITATTSAPYSFTFNDGSTYEHAMAGGAIPMSVWNTGSTCLITGITSASPGNAIQNFYNFTWNCPGQTTGLNLAWDNVVIGGNLTCMLSGSGTTALRLTSAATTRTITIKGDVIVTGGVLTASGSSGAAYYKIIVEGDVKLQGGTLNLCGGSGGVAEWYVKGNVVINSGATLSAPSSNNKIATRLIFSKPNGTQYFTNNGTNNQPSFGIDSGATVILNSPLTIGSTGGLELRNGKFVTIATNYLRCDARVYNRINITTASEISYTGINLSPSATHGYIEGPFIVSHSVESKTDTLPLGRNGIYRPAIITIMQNSTTPTLYTYELKTDNLPVNTLPSALDAVNSKWILQVTKGSGANVTSGQIVLSYGASDDNVANNSEIRVAMDNGAGNWLNLGGSGTAPNEGTITSDIFSALTTNYFTIAHVNPASVAVPPTVTTNTVTFISTTFATTGGNITNSGNAAVTERGVCWNTTGTPTISDSKLADAGTGSGSYTLQITGLTEGTTYYVRAYAINSAGVGYGEEITFTTLDQLYPPTVTTQAVTNIVNRQATGNGTVTAWGGSDITERGVCWSTSPDPTLGTCIEYNVAGTIGLGSFTALIGGLNYGTTYYVRAYAKNATGTGYGETVTFTTPTRQPDVYKVVDQNGVVGVTCDYTKIQDAFNAVPEKYTGRWIIFVKKGVYYEKVWLTRNKMNVVLIGEDRDSTIITYDDYAGKNTVTVFPEGTIISNGTNTSFTCAIDAPDFEAQNITFQNTANAYAPGSTATQAVALRTNGDRQEYYNCKMLGYQDTYYTQGGITGPDRIYNKHCYIEGSVDFIFGRDVVVFDSCIIYTNRPGGVVTAASTEAGYSYGYVFLDCILASPEPGSTSTASGQPMTTFYLGRPWQAAPKTVYIRCYEPETVNPAGWTTMGPVPSLYAEYDCFGPGYIANRPGLAAWNYTQPTTITAEQAATYTLANIFSKNNKGTGFTYPSNWLPSQETDINYSMILSVELTSFVSVPRKFSLSQNYPNPFNPTTTIEFTLAEDGWTTLKIYDILGREVTMLVNGYYNAGQRHQVQLDASKLASGVYFYKLESGKFSAIRKFALMK